MWIEDADFDYADSNGLTITSGVTVINNGGYDIDAIAGYDFGMLRLEGELGYKHAGVNEVRLNSRLSGAGPLSNFDANGSSHALSLMINMLLDFGNEDGLSGYVGPGIGIARCPYEPRSGYSQRDRWLLRQPHQSRVAGYRGPALCRLAEHRRRPEVPLLQRHEPQVRRTQRGRPDGLRPQGPLAFAQHHGERDLQFWLTTAAASATSAASAASGDADVPGWIGDPGDRHLPGAAASASATTTGARARPLSGNASKNTGPGDPRAGFLLCVKSSKSGVAPSPRALAR